MKEKSKKIVIGVIGTDCHAEGNKLIESMLKKGNFTVINLGVLTPQIDFVHAALESDADAIIISSIHGKAEIDYIGTREKCDQYGMKNILLYAGGNLTSKIEEWDETKIRFEKMGFNRVYKPGTPFEVTLKDLKEDLKLI